MRLELTNEEIYILIDALDFYSRIWIGQYEEINSLLRLRGYVRPESLRIEDCKEDYLKLRSILIPNLANEDFNCSLGIWSVETNSLAKSAYDMQQIIRYTQAWHIHPEGGIGVNFNTPILEGELLQIKCRCQGDAAESVMIILGEERNFRLILESLEVYGCLFECKIEEMFKYYTDNAEVLQLAKNIEEVYVKIMETEITKVYPFVITIEKLKAKIEQLL